MFRVTFDRNVWTRICSSEQISNPVIESLRKSISRGGLEGFIPEVAFTLEGLTKKRRKAFLSTYEAKADCKIDTKRLDGKIGMDFSIEPNLEAWHDDDSRLCRELQQIEAWGFKLLRCVRVAKITNPNIDETLFVRSPTEETLETIYRFAECADTIEHLGAGIFHIKRIGENYSTNWRLGIVNAPVTASKKIAAAIAEWADGDGVAAHFAYSNDYFCTWDKARKAGQDSVMAPPVRSILEDRFQIKFVSPEDLCGLL